MSALSENTLLIGDTSDPAVGLIGAYLHQSGCLMDQHTTLFSAPEYAAVFFASHHGFLAALNTLNGWTGQIHILVRQQQSRETLGEWHTSLQLLFAAIQKQRAHEIQLWGLTEGAQKVIEESVGLTIAIMPPTAIGFPKSAKAIHDYAQKVLRIECDNRHTTLPISDLNYARLQHVTFEQADRLHPDLRDICAYANRPPAQSPAKSNKFVCVVSNGIGLGHLTRLLAIAKHMRAQANATIEFWCYSRAATLIEASGFAVHIRQTAEHLDVSMRDWKPWETHEFIQFLRSFRPDAVICDGSTILPNIHEGLRFPGLETVRLIWVRRGMWKKSSDTSPLEMEGKADLVLAPGDLAEQMDEGPTATYTPPHQGLAQRVKTDCVVAHHAPDLLSKFAARRSLGLWTHKPVCLVNLGGDVLESYAVLFQRIVKAADESGIRFVSVQSPFALQNPIDHPNIKTLHHYPIAPYLNAFDGIISAAGYNSFHETLLLSKAPILFAPNNHARVDDQSARAKFAVSQGWAEIFVPNSLGKSEAALARFLDAVKAKQKIDRAIAPRNGASQMADHILAFI